jgi:hypothetical protein
MAYKALKSFSGLVSMRGGEVRETLDADIAKDLLRAGYIEEVKPAEKAKKETKPVKEDKKPEKGRTKRG